MHPVSQTINLVTNNVNMTLSCEADGHNLKYAWERLNNTLPNNTRGANTTTLYFTFLRPGDAGKYRCRVFNDSGYGYSDYGVLQIHVPPPQIITQPKNTTAADPFGAHFTCSANGYGEIKIDWYNANVQANLAAKVIISEERSTESVTSVLFIPHVTLEDEGGYFCSVKIGRVSTKSNIAFLEAIISPMVTVEMDNTTVNLLVKNYNLSMECLPPDTDLEYQWHKKNSSLPSSAVGGNTPYMTIYRLTPEDSGEYQCLLTNASGTIASEFVTLQINVPPPELLIPPENITVSAYSEVTLSCTGRGFGNVKVAWTKPPSKVTTTALYATERYDDKIVSTLTIPHVVEIYSGTYCCAVVNHVGSSDVQCASLQVNIPCPEISLSSSHSIILAEESVTFTCQAFSFGSIHYQWERDSNQIPNKAVTDVCSTTLTVPNGSQFDEGLYCCLATNDCGTVKECAMLSVIAVPIITLQPQGTTVYVGTKAVTMSCSAVGHGTIKYQWERYLINTNEWTILPTDQQSDIANISIYTIEDLNKGNDGVYHCGASNIDGISYSMNTTITVYGPPSITSPSTQIEVIEGHELILTCAATNDIKSPFNADISWYGPQGELIKETDKNIDISAIKIENVLTSALKFKSVNHTLTGVSKCKASNHPMSSSEFNFTITVEYAPRVYVSPSSPFTIKPGPKFLLHCSAEGRPSPTLQWYKNGQPYTTATTLSVQQIFVPRSSPSDNALYQCVAVNKIGGEIRSTNASIDFQVVVPTKGPCAINNGGCDQICTDESGTIQCYCEAGYFSIAFLPTKCFEVDECLYKLDKCEASCINTPGSYKCSCPYGQVLASDGYGCIQCANDTSGTNYTEIQPPRFISATENVWHVAICGTNSTTCSGSLINDNFVITSASCVCDEVTFPQSLMVKMNKKFGCQTKELSSVDYNVIQIICHPMYNDTILANNVALLKLDRIVNTSIFKPVCLPTDRDQSITSINRFSGVHGYEHFDYIGSSNHHGDVIADVTEELYIQVTEIVSIKECYIAYGYVLVVDNRMLCTSSGNYTNCWGKSGSPVVTSSEVDDHVILAGIANYRERKEQNMCSSSVPYGVHTKMDDGLQQWIGDHVTV
ncbi:hemicentin-1-like [Dysidea avara]|uniref:hemicentin-1-like n=1 Tax=Dysidea avara TaxID=196820 RepID=UPI00332E5997